MSLTRHRGGILLWGGRRGDPLYLCIEKYAQKKFDPGNKGLLEKYEGIRQYLMHEKQKKIRIPPIFCL